MRTEGEKPAESPRWLKRDAWKSRYRSKEKMAFWNEHLENARRVQREMSTSALRWPIV